MVLPPLCLFCVTCCVTTVALVVQGMHKGRAAAVTQKHNFPDVGDHWASWPFVWSLKGGAKVAALCKGGLKHQHEDMQLSLNAHAIITQFSTNVHAILTKFSPDAHAIITQNYSQYSIPTTLRSIVMHFTSLFGFPTQHYPLSHPILMQVAPNSQLTWFQLATKFNISRNYFLSTHFADQKLNINNECKMFIMAILFKYWYNISLSTFSRWLCHFNADDIPNILKVNILSHAVNAHALMVKDIVLVRQHGVFDSVLKLRVCCVTKRPCCLDLLLISAYCDKMSPFQMLFIPWNLIAHWLILTCAPPTVDLENKQKSRILIKVFILFSGIWNRDITVPNISMYTHVGLECFNQNPFICIITIHLSDRDQQKLRGSTFDCSCENNWVVKS